MNVQNLGSYHFLNNTFHFKKDDRGILVDYIFNDVYQELVKAVIKQDI